uniref:Fc receptor like protein 4 n=1 Tax=Paralichthys olivaceus TaxID=8255 RepID=A0A451FD47_PAROL|nr:Fc receptor like protein 4 [Paralichthys olivaceus]
MKTTLLFLLTFINQTSADNRALLSLTSDSREYFQYENIRLKCQHVDSDDWTVWKYTTDGLKMSQCGESWGSQVTSTCYMKTVKQSDSGVYWCQSKQGHSSNPVNITITSGSVILQSPVLPVAAGDNITLLCKKKTGPSNLPATFNKNGFQIRETPKGHMTIHNFSKQDEGAYECNVSAQEKSQLAWLLIKDDLGPVSLSVSPDWSQLKKYENLTLNCANYSHSHGWTIKRSTSTSESLSNCEDWGNHTPTGCLIKSVKEADTAIYWCESPARQRSTSINITVHNGPVILRSPALPVAAKENVTLFCIITTSPDNHPAVFYKNGVFLRETPTHQMTIHFVSKSDEGVYKCKINDKESPPAQLFVTGGVKDGSIQHSLITLVIIRIVVILPYVVSTLLLVFVCRQRSTEIARPVSLTKPPPGEDDEGLEHDVVADITTEHHF